MTGFEIAAICRTSSTLGATSDRFASNAIARETLSFCVETFMLLGGLSDPSLPSDGIPPGEAPGHIEAASSPVQGDEPEKLEPGVALCLSGGGYRAMLFHVGAIWRLNELGYLPKLNRVSSVSGGSITNGVLALNWTKLRYDDDVATNLDELFVQTATQARVEDDRQGGGVQGDPAARHDLRPGRRRLPQAPLRQDAPAGPPRRAALRLQRDEHADRCALALLASRTWPTTRSASCRDPEVELAVAVAASSAFPPILSPVVLDLEPGELGSRRRTGRCTSRRTRRDAVLSDGGVYDNLGLETAWKRYKTILVSDGGGKMGPQPKPKHDWARHAYRTLERDRHAGAQPPQAAGRGRLPEGRARRHVLGNPQPHRRLRAARRQPASAPRTRRFGSRSTATRLKEMDDTLQERLINWGYAICDAAMRRWVEPDADRLQRPSRIRAASARAWHASRSAVDSAARLPEPARVRGRPGHDRALRDGRHQRDDAADPLGGARPRPVGRIRRRRRRGRSRHDTASAG